MKYIAAYALLQIGGNDAPDADAVKKVLESVSIEVDEDKLNKLISTFEGKSLDDLLAAGQEKFKSLGPATGGAAAAAEPEPEEEEEAPPAMDMFGGDDEADY